MIEELNELIGASYAEAPTEYLICCLLLIWFIYQLFTLLYWCLGGRK